MVGTRKALFPRSIAKRRLTNSIDHTESAGSIYRAYLIGQAGRVESATPIEAATDAEAVEKARQLLDGLAIELWDRSRLVVRLDPDRS